MIRGIAEMDTSELHVGLWSEPVQDGRVKCTLCPRYCKIPEGKSGFCFVRKNIDGEIYNLAYGRPTGFAVDPVEKKPLYHFLPGTGILSFGTAGCNLGCKFCQNWHMSKAKLDDARSGHADPEDVVALAKKRGCPSIAYTYNDPTIWAEYAMDTSRLAREEGIRNVWVTAGYITPEARMAAYRHVDAANVDLKAFTDSFYVKLTSSHLDNVLDTLLWLKRETDVWVEITNLMIPTYNDDDDEVRRMIGWILENMGENTPLHFTAFHPDFKLKDVPPTSHSTLINARNMAKRMGIKYCYLGNVLDTDSSTTYCPGCSKPLIKRSWHNVLSDFIDEGKCSGCGAQIAGVFI